MDYRQVKDVTKLVKNEIYVSNLFDSQLKNPIKLISLVYFVVFAIILVGGAFAIFGFKPYPMIISVGASWGLAKLATTPIFAGRTALDALIVYVKYLASPRVYADHKEFEANELYVIDHQIAASRKRDFEKLAAIEKEIRERELV